jgi:hypothetical protein
MPLIEIKFMALVRDNASDVFVELFFEFWSNQGEAAFNGEDSLNVDLGVGVCHSGFTFRS